MITQKKLQQTLKKYLKREGDILGLVFFDGYSLGLKTAEEIIKGKKHHEHTKKTLPDLRAHNR